MPGRALLRGRPRRRTRRGNAKVNAIAIPLALQYSRGYNGAIPRKDGPVDREAIPPQRIAEPGWRSGRDPQAGASLGAMNASVRVPGGSALWLRRFLAFAGPGYLVSVGYMDPGNWATDLAGGSQFGYTLLCVIALSNVMAIVLQALAARLGIATGRDLAQACRD